MNKEITLSGLVNMILFRIKSIMIVAVCAAIAAFSFTYAFAKPVYSYTGSLMINASLNDDNNISVTQAGQAFLLASYYVDTYVNLLKSNAFCAIIQEDAVQSLAEEDMEKGTDKSLSELISSYKAQLPISSIKSIMSFSYQEDLLLFSVNIRSKDQRLANAVAHAAIKNAPEFSKLYGESCELKVVDNVSGSVSKTNPFTMGAIALVIAAIVMIFIYVLYNTLDHKVKDEIGLGERFENIPVLGVIPDFDAVVNNNKSKEN